MISSCASSTSLGVTHLIVKTKHMRASQEDYALDSLVLHATVFLFNCVISRVYSAPFFSRRDSTIFKLRRPSPIFAKIPVEPLHPRRNSTKKDRRDDRS